MIPSTSQTSDKLPQEEEEQEGKTVQNAAAKKDVGGLRDIFSIGFPPSPKPSEPKQSGRHPMQAEPGFQQAVFPLNGGNAIVQWPEHISSAEFEDFQDWLELVIRKVKRSVSESRSASNKEADAESQGD